MADLDFHEIWWIATNAPEEWGGRLRIAHLRHAVGGELIVVISGETDPGRIGVRIWSDVEAREGWRKVAQIAVPTAEEVAAAFGREEATK